LFGHLNGLISFSTNVLSHFIFVNAILVYFKVEMLIFP